MFLDRVFSKVHQLNHRYVEREQHVLGVLRLLYATCVRNPAVALIFALGWFGTGAIPLIVSRIFSFVNSFVFVSAN